MPARRTVLENVHPYDSIMTGCLTQE